MAHYNHKIKKKVMLTLYLSIAFGIACGYVFGPEQFVEVERILDDYRGVMEKTPTREFNTQLALIVGFACFSLGVGGIFGVKYLQEHDLL